MNTRERFLTAINGGEPYQMALTIWNNKLPGGDIDKQLLDLGVCVIVKSSVWKMEYQGVEVVRETEGRKAIANGVSEDVPYMGVKTLLPIYKYLKQFSMSTKLIHG